LKKAAAFIKNFTHLACSTEADQTHLSLFLLCSN